jgi:adenosylhomocysteine nucleosidase
VRGGGREDQHILLGGGKRVPSVTTVLCTSGLAAEAEIARLAGLSVVMGGGDPHRTAALVEMAVAGASCLVSFGIAGALAPRLRPGSVVVSGEVIGEERRWRVDAAFQERIAALAREIGAAEGPVYGADAILATSSSKARAWARTGALVADLESAIVARIAHAEGIPFLVVRAVADPASRNLPHAAQIPLRIDGKPEIRLIFAAMLRRPHQIGELIRLRRETRAALSALVGPARALSGLAA